MKKERIKNRPDNVRKPWGTYTVIEKTKKYWIKKLVVHKGARLSLQSHARRSEIQIVLRGVIVAIVGNTRRTLHAGDMIKIRVNKKHRIIGIREACVLEIAFGEVAERDIIRYQDDYGRVQDDT